MNAPKSQKTFDWTDEELARNVLDYLAEHPGAMDTSEGIAEWWLLRQRVRIIFRQVERVLQRLTEQGALEAVGSDPVRRYRLKKSAAGDAAALRSRDDELSRSSLDSLKSP